jgi:hypothetical protein
MSAALRRFFKIIRLGIFGLGLSGLAYASSTYVTYVVKDGDRLSKVAGKMIKGPVWGESGSLKKVLALNPQIENSNSVYRGQKILLPPALAKELSAESLESLNGELDAELDASTLTPIASAEVVREGDKLSKIVGRLIPGPVWGKNGSWTKVLKLNPGIGNPDLIYPGEEIKLPGGQTLQLQAVATKAKTTRVPSSTIAEPTPIESPTVSPPSPLPVAVASPSPAVSPTQEVHAVTEENGGALELSPYYIITGLRATDKTTGSPASLASSLNAGVDARYYQLWSDSFKSFVQLKLGTLSFEQPTLVTTSLQSSSNFMSGIGLGGEFRLSQALSFRISGDYEKEAFVRATSTKSVTVDAVAVPELGGSLALDLLRKNSLTLGISGQYSELFQASTGGYTVLQGSLYGGKIYFKQDVGQSAVQTELGYSSRQQNTELTNQTEKDIVLQLRWFLPSGKKSEEK